LLSGNANTRLGDQLFAVFQVLFGVLPHAA
jgi:hypothetical protein